MARAGPEGPVEPFLDEAGGQADAVPGHKVMLVAVLLGRDERVARHDHVVSEGDPISEHRWLAARPWSAIDIQDLT